MTPKSRRISGTSFQSVSGITLVELLMVVAIIGILTAIAVPNFLAMRSRAERDACINNLRQIRLAKEQWALENNKDYDDIPSASDLDTYIKDGTASLVCPADPAMSFATSYHINNIGSNPTCKISTSHKLEDVWEGSSTTTSGAHSPVS
jgi:prepilin-type N-terminal cleavage/methylation domain-containing protein